VTVLIDVNRFDMSVSKTKTAGLRLSSDERKQKNSTGENHWRRMKGRSGEKKNRGRNRSREELYPREGPQPRESSGTPLIHNHAGEVASGLENLRSEEDRISSGLPGGFAWVPEQGERGGGHRFNVQTIP